MAQKTMVHFKYTQSFIFLFICAFTTFAEIDFLTSYPQVFESDSEKRINLYGSTAFRQRNDKFFGELARKTREVQKECADSSLEATLVISFNIYKDGSVDSVQLQESPIIDAQSIERITSSIASIQFDSRIPVEDGHLEIIQEFTFKKILNKSASKKRLTYIILGIVGGILILGGL